MVKKRGADADVKCDNFSSHSMRKTLGYHQRVGGASLDKLQRAFNHSSGAITLYVGILDSEIAAWYDRNIQQSQTIWYVTNAPDWSAVTVILNRR